MLPPLTLALLAATSFIAGLEDVFRRACYALIAAAALLSLPVWDKVR